MQPTKLTWAGAGIFCTVTILVMWLQGTFTQVLASKSFTHMHCPKCELEVTFAAANFGKPCPQCGPSGPAMVGTIGLRAENKYGAVGSRWGNLIAASVIGLAVAGSFVYAGLLYARKQAIADEQVKNRPIVCRCPHCTRKIGYPVQKVGMTTVCSRCKTAFTLPEGMPLEEA